MKSVFVFLLHPVSSSSSFSFVTETRLFTVTLFQRTVFCFLRLESFLPQFLSKLLKAL